MNIPLPQKHTSILTKKEKISSRVYRIEFTHKEPNTMTFLPGQFISLNVGEKAFRSYSIASDYKDASKIELLVSAEHTGAGADFIRNLAIGDEAHFIGPSGRFWLREPYKKNTYFFATGTGVAPFVSHFYKLADDKYDGCVRLYFGVRNDEELFYMSELKDLKSIFKDFEVVVCKSDEGKRVTDCLTEIDTNDASFYLCGHPMMIADVDRMLGEKGVSPECIYFEKFTVSTPQK